MAKSIIYYLLQQLPSLVTMFGCIVAAMVTWRRHPKVSLTVIIAMALMMLHVIVFVIASTVIGNVFLAPNYMDFQYVQRVRLVIHSLDSTGLAIWIGVLLVAVFMQRRPRALNTT